MYKKKEHKADILFNTPKSIIHYKTSTKIINFLFSSSRSSHEYKSVLLQTLVGVTSMVLHIATNNNKCNVKLKDFLAWYTFPKESQENETLKFCHNFCLFSCPLLMLFGVRKHLQDQRQKILLNIVKGQIYSTLMLFGVKQSFCHKAIIINVYQIS
ncbi:hypothetical protein FF38_00709 [Lucilia cuprina]|uniref:Uncharacterized protein n=1 Tax=Lucilia cuprina TaxID=7375 RepID=A0A0L0CBG2_LUCCU|nr:hypothetical protein FF38_00709 [Lucilia cuprina]